MVKTKTANWSAIAATLLFFAACGKKEESAPTPVLSPPNAIEKVPAQAEVKASSGPVELSFLLHKTQIKVGEYLWQQIRIRNVGDKEIIVANRVFDEPRQLRLQSRAGASLYLEALGPDGKPLKVEFQDQWEHGSDIGHGVSGLLEVEGPEEQAMLDGWKRQGLSDREIDNKLIDFNMKKRRDAEIHRHRPGHKLLPGQSVETKSAFYYSIQDKIHNRATPRPIGDFAQVDFFLLEQPGKYKVRAVYAGLQGRLAREAGLSIYPWNVLVRTPWVSITVLP